MDIEEIFLTTPIPKNKAFVNSEGFRNIIWIKFRHIHNLITNQDNIQAIEFVLNDFEAIKPIVTEAQNLTFVQYVIGTKYIELGLKYEKDEFLIKGIDELDQINEKFLLMHDLKADYYRLFSRGILVHFKNELDKNEDYQFSFENIIPLLKAKYCLFKIFSFLVEKNIELKVIVEARIMTDLISVLLYLSRWNEPFYILDKRTVIADYSPGFLNYLKAHTLNEIAWNTCCTIYPVMTFEIKKFMKAAMSIQEENDDWKKHLVQIGKEVNQVVEDNKFDLKEFEIKYNEFKLRDCGHTRYREWILANHIALCEHSIYCSCELSKTDDLKIRSSHKHTDIEWVDQFEIVLDKIKIDFNFSRHLLFLSENDHSVEYVRDEEIEISSVTPFFINDISSDYLLQAFKSAYSILDKIGRAIYLALGIKEDKIYFHNCWKQIKQEQGISSNRYLYSLYTIACDLSDTSKYSAFLEYKKWRNCIEHEFFYLVDDSTDLESIKYKNKIISEVVKISEFREKTHYMLQLCQSAIFSFVFFIRHESKNKAPFSDSVCTTDNINRVDEEL